MIEAGFMKKAIIVSDVMPYKLIARPGINSLTVKETKHGLPWALQMKKLVNKPAMIEDLAEQLHQDVKVKYHIKTVNDVRAKLYKLLIKNINNISGFFNFLLNQTK